MFTNRDWLILCIVQLILSGWAFMRLLFPGTMRDSMQYQIAPEFASQIDVNALSMFNEHPSISNDRTNRKPIKCQQSLYYRHIPISRETTISFELSMGEECLVKPICIQIIDEKFMRNHYFNRLDRTMTLTKQNDIYRVFEKRILGDIPYEASRSDFAENLNFIRYSLFQLALIMLPLLPLTTIFMILRYPSIKQKFKS